MYESYTHIAATLTLQPHSQRNSTRNRSYQCVLSTLFAVFRIVLIVSCRLFFAVLVAAPLSVSFPRPIREVCALPVAAATVLWRLYAIMCSYTAGHGVLGCVVRMEDAGVWLDTAAG